MPLDAENSSRKVTRPTGLGSFLAWWVASLACFCAGALPPEGTAGDRASMDRIAPAPLLVVDLRETAELRQERAGALPLLYRFSTVATQEVEELLRASFGNARERFLDRLEATFGQRRLALEAIAPERFREALRSLQKAEMSFPLEPGLAQLWAAGDSGELILDEWATLLRAAMAPSIQSDASPGEISAPTAPGSARLIPTSLAGPTLDLNRLEPDTLAIVPLSRIQSLSQARADLVKQFPAADRPTARFLATFLKENCWFDPVSSCLLEEQKTAGIWSVDYYHKGERIVQKGEVLTAKAKLALREIQANSASASARIKPLWADALSPAGWRKHGIPPALAAAGAFFVLLAGRALWRGRRPRRQTGSAAATAVLITSGSDGAAEGILPNRGVESAGRRSAERLWGEVWKRRAMSAERRLERLRVLFRLALATHGANGRLRRWVGGLLVERAQVLATQEQAERELADLERRFVQARTPLEERLRAYEGRIAELERQLAAKGEENRELLQATIVSTRKRLETARERGPLAWN